jgi:hypothetical protein
MRELMSLEYSKLPEEKESFKSIFEYDSQPKQ